MVSYLLAADHPKGASKAAFFEAHGFRRGNWQMLAEALRDHARCNAVSEPSRSRTERSMPWTAPSGVPTDACRWFGPSGSWMPEPDSQVWSPPTQWMYE